MRGRPATVRSELDMKGSDAVREVISVTRPRTFRVLGDHHTRSLDELGVPTALQSADLPPGLSQDVGKVVFCGPGEPIFQDRLRGCGIIRVQLGGDFCNRSF